MALPPATPPAPAWTASPPAPALPPAEGSSVIVSDVQSLVDALREAQPGQTILEVGCGTGFFTIPAAKMIGAEGCLIAMDALSDFVKQVSKKVQSADLKNVRVVKRDVLNTGLDATSIDTVLLFGVLPWPGLPLSRLLPEMHRILKPEGRLAVWLFPVSGWVPKSIIRSGLFTYISKQYGVYNYSRC